MKVSDIINAIERDAPLFLQDDFDNAGLQVGLCSDEVHAVLACLDVTEDIVNEAVERGCNLIVSHHPLLFHPLKKVSDLSYQQRCVRQTISQGISIYSAHTNLDNAPGGVNYRIAEKIGLEQLDWLEKKQGQDAGSGLIGVLPQPMRAEEFLSKIKDIFNVRALAYNEVDADKVILRVALCGGAGSFLIPTALQRGADCFITGEVHYHQFFEGEGMLIAALGHYESEQYTIELLSDMISDAFPDLRVEKTSLNTNPIRVK